MKSAFLRVTCICIVFASLAGCSKDNVSVAPEMVAQKRRPILDPRTNPLQEYIQDTWTNGDPDATGGHFRSHIKVYGHNHRNMTESSPPCANGAADVAFVVQNYDMFMWGGPDVGEAAPAEMLWLQEAATIAHIRTGWDTDNVNAWVSDPANGYDWFDIALHYQVNTSNSHSSALGLPYFKGWNPADDFDGDGIIEAGEGYNGAPSDPDRSAMDVAEARVRIGNPYGWIMANVAGPAYADFIIDIAIDEWDDAVARGYPIDGYHFDEAAWQNAGNTLGNTFQYWQADEGSPSFAYIEDKIAFPSSVMPDVEAHITHPVVALTNMVSTLYATHDPVQHNYAVDYLENILIEAWLTNSDGLVNVSNRAALLDDVYTDYLETGKGVVFGCQNNPQPNERMKLFSLGMFYMINHQMAFYFYREILPADCDMSTYQWNSWVNYDIGQPMVNDLNLDDFNGEANTNRYFILIDEEDYQVLGRLYQLPSNGPVHLVLVKLMAYGQSAGDVSSGTTVSLGQTYKKVLSNFQLGQPITSVNLKNNEAVILRRAPGGQGGCGGCEPEG
jgi:hypothetical protein